MWCDPLHIPADQGHRVHSEEAQGHLTYTDSELTAHTN